MNSYSRTEGRKFRTGNNDRRVGNGRTRNCFIVLKHFNIPGLAAYQVLQITIS